MLNDFFRKPLQCAEEVSYFCYSERASAREESAFSGFFSLPGAIPAEAQEASRHAMTNCSSSTKPTQSCSFDASKLDLKLSVTLKANRDSVDPVVRSVMVVVREMKCAGGREDDIELALTEALSNAVVHGAQSDPSKIVECDVACDEERGMLIVVRDPGTGFDPSKIADPCVGENIYSQHGRGIFLINQLMDEVQFHKNGTEIRMIKR